MSVQTFNPSDLFQSAANWAVSQRIVGNFAPHAQVAPNLTLALDPGNLLNGTTLTEVNAQSVGPFAPPSSGFRIDRVVVDRSTGAAAIVTGAANSLTPPAIPAGKLPVARVMLLPTTDAITNTLVVDERTIYDSGSANNPVTSRMQRNGVDQTGVPHNSLTKVMFTSATGNNAGAFDPVSSRFTPSIPGTYQIYAQLTIPAMTNGYGVAIYKNGSVISQSILVPGGSTNVTATAMDNVTFNGTTDYVEVYGYQTTGTTGTFIGGNHQTYMTTALIR